MGTTTIQCSYMGDMAGEELESFTCGSIIGVFHHGWYIGSRSSVWLLHNSNYGKVPFGIGIDGFERKIPYRKALEGSRVFWSDGKLMLPEAELALLLPTAEFHKAIMPVDMQTLRRMHAIAKPLLHEAGRGELRHLLMNQEQLVQGEKASIKLSVEQTGMFLPYAEERLAALFSALKDFQVEQAAKTIKKMIGLGAGLTPSMDDWIVGFLYVALRVETSSPVRELFDNLVKAVCASVTSRTNRISAVYLTAASRSLYFEALENALRATCPRDMEMLLEIGSSSGSDMLTGMTFAVAWLESIRSTEKFHL